MLNFILQTVIAASTYGSGTYNSSNYNGALVAIGPVVLPDTGAGWSVLVGSILVAVGGGVGVWLWQRRRRVAV